MSARNNSRNAKVAPKPFCKVCHDAGKSENEYTSHFVKSEPGSNGKVVCPTLLAQECRYCFGYGHTAGYCPEIAAKKKAEEKALKQAFRKEIIEKPAPKQVEKKLANKFAAFNDDSSDSDTDEKVSKKVTKPNAIKKPIVAADKVEHHQVAAKFAVKKEEFPSLPMKTTTRVTTVMSGYASAAAKTQEEYEIERYEQQLIANTMKKNQLMTLSTTQMKKSYIKEDSSKYDGDDSWEEEEEEVEVVHKPRVPASLLDWAATVDSDDEDW